MKTMSSELSLRRRRICVFMAVMFMFTIGIYTDRASMEFSPEVSSQKRSSTTLSPIIHRKLLNQEITTQKNKENEAAVVDEPNRIWREKCSKSDILISQGATEPLPNGIPTYTVEIMNVCFSGCNISAIHLNCGWFSSARLVNPRVFKRLHFDDCLVNGGKPLVNGRTLSFKYDNTFRYQLTVSSITC